MTKERQTRKGLWPFASLFLGVMLSVHALDPLLGHPIAHYYGRLSPLGQQIWDGTIIVVVMIGLAVAFVPLIDRIFGDKEK